MAFIELLLGFLFVNGSLSVNYFFWANFKQFFKVVAVAKVIEFDGVC